MSEFIQRKFKNIDTNQVVDFDNITKSIEFEKEYQSSIAIVLGEPASGKTYQLKEYNKQHKDKSLFIELINLDNTISITQDIDVVLIDSIDEALTDFNNPKKLQKKLIDFIKQCKSINPKVRFVITCRFLEWSNIFEESLKEIDKELRVYTILELSHDDIDNLLKQRNINKNEFWKFIEENYLEGLLKNILVILSIIDRFEEYKTKQVTFTDIYYEIVKEYLSKKGDDREEIASNISANKLFKIASSLATYMTFNRKLSVDSSDLPIVASKLYKIDGQDIVVDDLKVILNTALFKKNGNDFSFIHKSIQEYLTAVFLANKKFDSSNLKKLLASKLRFYEEFEEVVVFLTNIKIDLFNDFVKFDPFIFKRHPALSKEQQEILLKTLLDKFDNDEVQAWGRWESFIDSTLVKFDKLDNLVDILKNHYAGNNANYYLIQLLKYNYSKELKSFIFDIFSQKLNDKESLKNLIRGNFIDNYDFNVELYDFMKENDLFVKDEHMLFMSFEAELFCSLYGIKYKYQYGTKRVVQRTNFEFQKLLYLFKYIPTRMLEYVAPYLRKEDALKWFEYLKGTYNVHEDDHEYVLWVVYAVLKHYSTKNELENIVKFVKENHIYLHSYDKEKMKLDFQKISKDFWELYFESDLFDGVWSHNNIIFALYDITLDDIKEIAKKYPIKDNLENYFQLIFIENVNTFLMQDDDFKRYMENLWKQHEERQKKQDAEFRKGYPDLVDRKKEEEKFLQECIDRFGTDDEKENDLYNIFFKICNVNNIQECENNLKTKLYDKYTHLIQLIKQKFETDNLYKKIKDEICSNSIYYDSLLFKYLFSTLSNGEIEELIKSKKDYIKLFWHAYRFSLNFIDDYFIQLTKKYFECFQQLTLHTLQLSIKESKNKKIGNFHLLIDVYKKLDKFDEYNLNNINKFLKKNKNIFVELEEQRDKETLLEIISLEQQNFNFILELLNNDKSNTTVYFQYLLQIDSQKAMKNFLEIYNKEKTYKPWWIRLKNYLIDKKVIEKDYDKFEINPKKIELYKNLLFAIKGSKIGFDNLENIHLKILLQDYYNYFLPYQRPKGVHVIGTHENMYEFINKVWEYLQNSTKHIDLLEELVQNNNSAIAKQAQYALTKAYELQEKDRSYPNSYYKEIFDKNEIMDKTTININGDKHNIAINSNNVKQIQNEETSHSGSSKWQKWWFISLFVGFGVGIVLWWKFSWLYGVVGFLISFFIIMLFNPKRRFFRAAWIIFALSGVDLLPKIVGVINVPENSLFNGIIKFGDSIPPWLIISLFLLSGFLFWLDHKENKNDN